MASFSQRLLPVLQLTRMALVFTALADSGCALLLNAQYQSQINGHPLWKQLWFVQCLALMFISIGLYGFGMSLNDIIDRRRDAQISPSRPIPSGSIGLGAAHAICVMLVLMALVGGEMYSYVGKGTHMSLVLTVVTMAVIAFYDFAAKYIVPVGILSLGLIRFFHAAIAAPNLPVLWHPILLMNHVTIVSTLAYHWEQKRPRLRRVHLRWIWSGLIAADVLVVSVIFLHRVTHYPDASIADLMVLKLPMLGPIFAAALFVPIAMWIWRRSPNRHEAGQALNLAGLLWLIVYDATFVTGFCGIFAGMLILLLLPIAYVAVLMVGWWGKLMLLSQRPTFRRVET
jgi:4-hydroxybenzoate polyprenyltransferase